MKKILFNNWVINFIAISLIILGYQTIHYIAHEPLVFPSITQIAWIGIKMVQTKLFWSTLYYTFSTLLIGWLLSIVCISFAVALSWYIPFVRRIFECYCGYFGSLPNFTIIPFLILLFGVTNNVMITVMVFSVFFIMGYQILGAFDNLAITWEKHVKNLNWGLYKSITKVYLPASAPVLLSMASMSWTYMWRTLISLEVVFGNIGGYMGLGTYLIDVKTTMDIDKMYVVLFFIATLGFLMSSLFKKIKERYEY